MSVPYDSDPGRLEVYRPRADGLLGRSFCASLLIHLLVGCILFTVRFPKPKAPPQRHYRITEVTLLAPRPAPALEAKEEKVAEAVSPRDLSLFLNDMAPVRTRRHHHGRRHSRTATSRTAVSTPNTVAREPKPEAPEPGDLRRSTLGPKLAQGLPNFLERPMAETQPVAPTLPPASARQENAAPKSVPAPRPTPRARSRSVPRSHAARHTASRPPIITRAPQPDGGGDRREPSAAPQPVRVARAERPRPLADLLPGPHDLGGAAGTTPKGPASTLLPTSLPEERPVDLPSGHAGSGKRIAQLPGDLFGSGSGVSPGPSQKAISLPEGRPGASDVPGPRHPRASRGKMGKLPSLVGGEAAGINPVPAPGGVRLPEEERPGALRSGATSDLGELGGKGTPVAALPSTGSETPGNGSGASSQGGGAGGGYGAEGPRAFGGQNRPGRPGPHSHAKIASTGDGTGGAPSADSGIGIPGAGPGGGSDTGSPSDSGRGAGDRKGDGRAPGKRMARADLPLDGAGEGGRGSGHGSGAGGGTGPAVDSGPKSFGDAGKRRVSGGPGGGSAAGRRKSKGDDQGDGDPGGVSLPSGGGSNDDPGRDAGDGASDSGFQRGRTRPTGVYVSTTGRFTLPGAIHDGDYQYNSAALRIIMDELNSRTKVKVRLGGKYESIAPGSFQNAPVVVFTGHKAFELTDEQRKVLKDYVDRGGMIWADFSHAAPFEDSFRSEMEKVFGSRPVPLAASHRIYRSFYVLQGPPAGDVGDPAAFEGIAVGDRLGVVITPNRYFSAVSHSISTSDEVQEGATQAVVNIYMYAAANYRAVKDAGD